MTTTAVSPERYLELIDADTERLIALGERGLTEKIPCCPDWDVAEVVWHTAGVYQHKVRVMADNAWPEPWPPADFEERAELAFLREAKDDLFAELSRHDVSEITTTFGPDSTIGFWVRRMALEVAVHRYDAELAHGDTTPIDPALAVDGIDEILRIMLAGPWWAHNVQTEHPVDALVAVAAGGTRWLCDIQRTAVTVTDDSSTSVAATVSGEPEHVFLWLWGRVGDEAATLDGDPKVISEFRSRLVECTG